MLQNTGKIKGAADKNTVKDIAVAVDVLNYFSELRAVLKAPIEFSLNRTEFQ